MVDMSESYVRNATAEDVESIVAHLRPMDLADIAALTDMPPGEAIRSVFTLSQRKLAFIWKGTLVAVGGIQFEDSQRNGSIWIVGNKELDGCLAGGGLRFCAAVLKAISRDAGTLYNFVRADNVKGIKWLQWMGFRIAFVTENFRGLGCRCVKVELDVSSLK